MMKRILIFAMAGVYALGLPGCSSKYSRNLYLTTGEERRKTSIEQTEYLIGAQLADPYAVQKVTPSRDNVIVVTTSTRGQQVKTEFLQDFLQFDETLVSKLFIQLPPQPKPDTIALLDHSVVQVLGRYEQPAESKIFLPKEGTFVIDSLANNKLYGTVVGTFENPPGQTLKMDGNFWVKMKK